MVAVEELSLLREVCLTGVLEAGAMVEEVVWDLLAGVALTIGVSVEAVLVWDLRRTLMVGFGIESIAG